MKRLLKQSICLLAILCLLRVLFLCRHKPMKKRDNTRSIP